MSARGLHLHPASGARFIHPIVTAWALIVWVLGVVSLEGGDDWALVVCDCLGLGAGGMIVRCLPKLWPGQGGPAASPVSVVSEPSIFGVAFCERCRVHVWVVFRLILTGGSRFARTHPDRKAHWCLERVELYERKSMSTEVLEPW